MTTGSETGYSFPIDITQLSSKGREYQLTAKDDERREIAGYLGLLELPSLNATVTLTQAANGIITVSGVLQADVVQQCVVSLAPVQASISESFELGFTRTPLDEGDEEELEVSPYDDPPDTLTGDSIDLGEIVVEQLALFLDPYPRAPGAVFQNPSKEGDEPVKATVSPFAVLAKLKTQNKNN